MLKISNKRNALRIGCADLLQAAAAPVMTAKHLEKMPDRLIPLPCLNRRPKIDLDPPSAI